MPCYKSKPCLACQVVRAANPQIVQFKTATGSTYILDSLYMTWARIERPRVEDPKYALRTQHGELNTWPDVVVGRGVIMECPALHRSYDARIVYTSDVVSIKHLDAPPVFAV